MASLTMLGVGHSESLRHWNNNALITADDGARLLIDAGYTIKFALRDAGLTPADVDAIFITHVHADHCFGLERLAFECRLHHGSKPHLFLPPGVREELWEHTLRGVLGRLGEGAATLDDFFEVVEPDDDVFEFHGVRLHFFPNRHIPEKPSYGLWINGKLFYSGDTGVLPDLNARFDPETALHDCTLAGPNPVHASLNELLDVYPPSLRRCMYLMSYEDDYEAHRPLVEQEFAGFARQGQEFAL